MVYSTNMIDVFKVVCALLGSVAIGGGIVAGIVKFAADWISKRTLDAYNNQHAKDLEALKAEYSEALVKTNHELEKAERRDYLYSQSQFELYNSLWMQLVNTRRMADELWKDADPQRLPSFADQISQTKYVIEMNMLLIEQDHYNQLIKLMEEFESFKVGKQTVFELRKSSVDDILANIHDVSRMISVNKECKERYDDLVSRIGDSFRKQIHG